MLYYTWGDIMEHLILRNIIKDQHEVIKNAKIYDRNYKLENNIQNDKEESAANNEEEQINIK